jgi:hypothetical protein
MLKAISYGLPVRLCPDLTCGCVDAHPLVYWLYELLARMDFSGAFAFMPYEGSYWKGLADWWRATKVQE